MEQSIPDRSKYWGNVVLSGLVVVLAWVAAMKHEIPWSWCGVVAALCMGWMTPAVIIDGFRMYVRALHAMPPGAAAAAQALSVSVDTGEGPGGPGSGVVVAAVTAPAPAPRRAGPRRSVPPSAGDGSAPRMSWPSPGLLGLAESLQRWGVTSSGGALGVVAAGALLLGAGVASCSGAPASPSVSQTSARLRDVVAVMERATSSASAAVGSAREGPEWASLVSDLRDAAEATSILRGAADAFDAAAADDRRAAGCRVRVVGGQVVAVLGRVLAFLSGHGVPVPAWVGLGLQGGGLLLDVVAPACPAAGAGPSGSSHAWAVRELRAHGAAVEPLPASWRVRFARELAASGAR